MVIYWSCSIYKIDGGIVFQKVKNYNFLESISHSGEFTTMASVLLNNNPSSYSVEFCKSLQLPIKKPNFTHHEIR